VPVLKQKAADIFNAGIRAVDPGTCVQRHLCLEAGHLVAGPTRHPLQQIDHILVIGAGKAAAVMAAEVERILPGRIAAGVVVTKYGHGVACRKVRVMEAGHPIPDENGVQGAQAILDLVAGAGEHDLIISLISGGGSALIPAPVPGVSLLHKQAVTRELLACGASIDEINTIRKHLSRIKGGQLCRAVRGSRMISLILSDVVGDDVSVIASGATAADASTFLQCRDILQCYGLENKIAPQVAQWFEMGCRGEIPETPKPGDPDCAKVPNVVIGSISDALAACRQKAQDLGFAVLTLSSMIQGEAREVAKVLCAVAKEVRRSGHPVKAPACLLSGGETTVTLRGAGKGGRNMELALAAAIQLGGARQTVLLSSGTDGSDGPTDAAGAFADGTSVARAGALGLSAAGELQRNNAYHFFKNLGDLHITGPTRTNVMDLQIFLIE
jgi:glycerate 2-kinase